MGWFYSEMSKAALIKELTRADESDSGASKTIAHTLGDDGLWSVVEVTLKVDSPSMKLKAGDKYRFIRLDLLECSGNQWGHKSLTEEMWPFYYDCPLSYLEMVPESCPKWRQIVRSYHACLGSVAA